MNIDQAKDLMRKGVKTTHTYCSKKEWVTFENGRIIYEDGNVTTWCKFWEGRSEWIDGWGCFIE